MIGFDRVWFSYGKDGEEKTSKEKTALPFRDLSFHVPAGERVWLRGESGCGKTTLLRLILGLETPARGTVKVGTDRVSVLFQENRLLPYLSVAENCALFARGASAPETVLRELGLEESANALPSALSGGMARRAALARMLSHEAELYLLDEPFNGLDEENVRRCAKAINRITAGKTVLVVTHHESEAEALHCTTPLDALCF